MTGNRARNTAAGAGGKQHPAMRWVLAAVLALALAASPSPAAAAPAGTVRYVKMAGSDFDVFTSNPSPARQAWMRREFARMVVWRPYFQSRTAWYPRGWLYRDAMALYPGSPEADRHPDWALRDRAGRPVYVDWGCARGRCPQYAADLTNPKMRAAWVRQAAAHLKSGRYRGLFIDDVNMLWRFSDGRSPHVRPVSPASGREVTLAAYRRGMVALLRDTRRALGARYELIHNALWFADRDRQVRAQLLAADYVNFERGAVDAGLTGGAGYWSLRRLLALADWLHIRDRHVVWQSYAETDAEREYNLAVALLVSDGHDLVSSAEDTPARMWPGYRVRLGTAKGRWRFWRGVWRRDFAHGVAVVNPPGAAARTVAVRGRRPSGRLVTSVRLRAASGVVLTRG